MNFHGGNIYSYKGEILDFSANINPLGIPNSFKEAICARLDEFTRYPDIHYSGLRENIAAYLGISDKKCIYPGNGAVDVIYKAILAAGSKRVYSLSPTFSEYQRAAVCSNAAYEELQVFYDDYRKVDADHIVDSIMQKSTLVICNPNNPTGTLIDKEQMLYIAEKLHHKDSVLIIDEAFMEFTDNCPNDSMISQLNVLDNVVVIKAATKFFGIPGIRLGYGITYNKQILSNIMSAAEPWGINTAAVIAADVIFKDAEYIEASKKWILKEREYVYQRLSKIKYLKPFRSQANFHLVEIMRKDLDSWQLRDIMAAQGVLIRTPDGFSNLTPYHFRLAIRDRASNDLMLKLLEASLCI